MPHNKNKRRKTKNKAHPSKVSGAHSNTSTHSNTSAQGYSFIYLLIGFSLIIASLAMFFVSVSYMVKGIMFLVLFSFGSYTLKVAKRSPSS